MNLSRIISFAVSRLAVLAMTNLGIVNGELEFEISLGFGSWDLGFPRSGGGIKIE